MNIKVDRDPKLAIQDSNYVLSLYMKVVGRLYDYKGTQKKSRVGPR